MKPINPARPGARIHRHPAADGQHAWTALTIDGKPAIVFASEESCPFCAAERRPLVVALSNSGSWSHLGSTKPSATDVPGHRHALVPRGAELTLRTTELTDNLRRPLNAQTPLDTRPIGTYDDPPRIRSCA